MRFKEGTWAADSLVNITHINQKSLLDDLALRAEEGRGFLVATLNLDHLVKLRRDATFRAAYERHSHVVADGNPIVWLHRLAGERIDLITGSDLVEPVLELARDRRIPVAFLGSTQQTLDGAASRLAERYPGLEVVARIAPDFGFDPNGVEADQAIKRIEGSGAGLCLLALGAPKQEIFAARAADALPRCGFISVGAGLDFIAGTQRRAPLLWRKLALEWLWRLSRDFHRLARRYRDCALILPGLFGAALRVRVERRYASFKDISGSPRVDRTKSYD